MADISKINVNNTVYDIKDTSKYTNEEINVKLAAKVDKNAKVTGYFTGTYITGGYFAYIEINGVVTFYIEYIPSTTINNSIGDCNIALPAPIHTVKYPVTPENVTNYNAFGYIHVVNNVVKFNALGAATQGTTYYVQGSYIKG